MDKYRSNISYGKLLGNIKCMLLKVSFLCFSSFSTKLQIHVNLTDIVIHFPDDKNRHGSQNVRSLTVHPLDMVLDYVELYSFSLLLQAGTVYIKWACKQAQ
jgi:hypothetical protein